MMVLFILVYYICILTILCNDTIATVVIIGLLPLPFAFIHLYSH